MLKVPNCERLRTLVAYTPDLHPILVLAVPCLAWSCPECAAAKTRQLIARISEAKPNHFLTLTTRHDEGTTPRSQFLASSRMLGLFSISWRRRGQSFEYVRFLESTLSGWPHFHLLCRSGHSSRSWISTTWCEMTGAYIVDYQPLFSNTQAIKYCVKYLTKQLEVEYTKRRVSWTKKFFPPTPDPEPKNPHFHSWKQFNCTPEHWLDTNQYDTFETLPDSDGYRLPLPEGWTLEHAIAQAQIIERAKEMLATLDEINKPLTSAGSSLPMSVERLNTTKSPHQSQLPYLDTHKDPHNA